MSAERIPDYQEVVHGGVRACLARPVANDLAGGDGGVTAFHDYGGRILANCRIVLIFWGSAWANLATNPSQASFANALGDIVEGPWATQLAQYRGIGRISIEQTIIVSASDPAASFTNPQIQTLLNQLITAGTIPAPANNVDRLYCVLMPTGHSSGDTNFVGQHQFFTHNGVRGYYAWISNDGTLTGGNSIPKVFSHEVAEACSDPDLGAGPAILVDVGSDTGEEIGDVCNNTWATVNGHAEEAYWSQADKRCVIPVAAAYPPVSGNPVQIQSRFGAQGNFELVTPAAGGGMFHIWRNNDNHFLPWSAPTNFGQSLGQVAAVSLIESNFGAPGNLEVICRVGNALQEFWRDSGPTFAWNGPAMIETGVAGNPVLIQSRFGTKGNFEVVSPAQNGGLVHFWRNDDAPGLPWSGPTRFGQSLGAVDAVTMIESNQFRHAGEPRSYLPGRQYTLLLLAGFWAGLRVEWPVHADVGCRRQSCADPEPFRHQGEFRTGGAVANRRAAALLAQQRRARPAVEHPDSLRRRTGCSRCGNHDAEQLRQPGQSRAGLPGRQCHALVLA
jgi:hypothetical protein